MSCSSCMYRRPTAASHRGESTSSGRNDSGSSAAEEGKGAAGSGPTTTADALRRRTADALRRLTADALRRRTAVAPQRSGMNGTRRPSRLEQTSPNSPSGCMLQDTFALGAQGVFMNLTHASAQLNQPPHRRQRDASEPPPASAPLHAHGPHIVCAIFVWCALPSIQSL